MCVCARASIIRKLEEERMKNPNFNLTLEDFAYFDENNISMTITDFMKSTDFEGITVRGRNVSNSSSWGLPSTCFVCLSRAV